MLDTAEIRRMLHALREPLAAFAIHLELIEREPSTVAAQASIKSMNASLDHVIVVFGEVDFFLENGHRKPIKGAR